VWLDLTLKGAAVGGLALVSLVAGGIWSGLKRPSPRTRSVVQHAAAGTVFAGLTVDVLPRLLEVHGQFLWLIVGMCVGLAVMLGIRVSQQRSGGSSLGLTTVADVITDGALMGLSTAAGAATAYLFVIALMPEMTLLGLTASEEFAGKESGTLKRAGLSALIGAGVCIGGIIGALLRLAPEAWATSIEAFGAVALAYFVMEELLREAHEQGADAWLAATFFAGFIPLFLVAAYIG
jgi:ZIP family zinc transporter